MEGTPGAPMSEELQELAREMNERITALRERDVDVTPEDAETIVSRHRIRRSPMTDEVAREQALLIEREVREAMAELFRNHRPANQGNNGIIYKVSERDVGAVHADSMQEGGFLDRESAAAKVLKIYNPGEGVEEFRMQQRAHAVLERFRAAHPEAACALIPRALQMRDYEFDEATIDSLNASGASLHSTHAETLFMDYIPAKDFARIIYEEVLVRTNPRKLEPYGKNPNESMEEFAHGNRSMEDLWLLVSRMLNLENPETKATDGTIAVDQKILFRNSGKIFSFLAAAGYKVHPRLAEQLSNTVAALHEGGIYHNDVHERNLMVIGNPQSGDAQLYLIDFGAARDKGTALDRFRPDESLPNILRQMQEAKLDVLSREDRERVMDVVDKIEKNIHTPAAAAAHDRLHPLIGAQSDGLGEYMVGTVEREGELIERLAGLKLLVDEGAITPEEADAVLERTRTYIEQEYIRRNKRKRNKEDYRPQFKKILWQCRMLFRSQWRAADTE